MRPLEIPDIHHLEINITYRCTLACANCNRVIDRVKYTEETDVTPEFVARHMLEAEESNHRWKDINIIGGEPTIHPRFREIVHVLLEYQKKSGCKLEVSTNGYSEQTRKEIEWVKSLGCVRVTNSKKDGIRVPRHIGFTQAPSDTHPELVEYKGCKLPRTQGIALDYRGYYVCATAAVIANIFDLNIAIPHIKDVTIESMISTYNTVCSRCGHYTKAKCKEEPSPQWRLALQQYNAR